MSELVTRAKALLGGTTPGPWQNVGYGNIQPETVGEHPPIGKIYGKANQRFVAASRRLVPELIEAVEFLESAADHWKTLWQGTVKDSTKVMEERDEALRESLLWQARAELHISECAAADAVIERVEALIQKWDDTEHLVARAFASGLRDALREGESGE